MKLTSVDLVKQGANPKAHFKILKSAEGGETKDMSFMAKLKKGLNRVLGVTPSAEQLNELAKSIERDPYAVMEEALKKSAISILKDEDLSDDDKQSMLEVSIEQFCKALKEEKDPEDVYDESEEDEEEPEDLEDDDMEKKKCETKKSKEGEETLVEIDITKMSEEDRPIAEKLIAKYAKGIGTEDQPSSKIHPEVKKALDELEEFKKAATTEVSELKKQLEIKDLTQVAKKYEILGKKPEELAEKLYELKKAGGTTYEDYTALLDQMVATTEASNLFGEVGASRSGSGAGLNEIIKGIMEKEPTLTREQAVCKAYEQHPELDPFTGELKK